MSQPLKPETLTEIRTYFGGYRKRGEHCSSPKCQPYAHALLAELFRLQDENARLRGALEAVDDLVFLAGEWLKSTAGLGPHYLPAGTLPDHRQRVTGAVVRYNELRGAVVRQAALAGEAPDA